MTTKNRTIKEAITLLQNNKKKTLVLLKEVIKQNTFNYRTFGIDIEAYLSDILVKLFKENGFITKNGDYVLAPHKNYFPDFTLKISPCLAIEYKSGNKSQSKDGKWISVKNSENDMGTLNEWPKKIDSFGCDNIYYIFIIYNFNDHIKEILDVQIDPFYKFIGINKDGFLKYREKDGNLRPKDFDSRSPITSAQEFLKLLGRTNIYRSERIIKKHQMIVRDASRGSHYE